MPVCVPATGLLLLRHPERFCQDVGEESLLIKRQIQESQCSFHLGLGTLDQFSPLQGWLEGAGDFSKLVHMCFVYMEKAFKCESLVHIVKRRSNLFADMAGTDRIYSRGCQVWLPHRGQPGGHVGYQKFKIYLENQECQ